MVNACLRSIGATLLLFSCSAFANAPLFNDLGSFHYSITTANPSASRYFDQGLTLFYGFEWSEAARSFKAASEIDPNCAMCFWGYALSLSYKMNAPMNGHEFSDGKAALQRALALKANEPKVNQELLQALTTRFVQDTSTIKKSQAFSCHSTSDVKSAAAQRRAFANAMRKIAKQFPDNIDVNVLYVVAEFWATMDETPAIHRSDAPPPHNIAARKVLVRVLQQNPQHVGANHYWIHLLEPYGHADQALMSARRLHSLVPGSEHLVHMPAHIYFLLGNFHQATLANQHAIETYHRYNQQCSRQGFLPEKNYLYFHNYDFLRSSAAMEGRYALAHQAVKQMLAEPFATWLKNEADLQWFMPIDLFVEARFGHWETVMKAKAPAKRYAYALGMWQYARAIALVHQQSIDAAREELLQLNEIIARGESNQSLGKSGLASLKIAAALVEASIADQQHDQLLAIEQLKIAAKLQDDKGYHEPPDWYFPIKEAVAQAYLKYGDAASAQQWFEKTLIEYPKNGWALYGLEKSLRAQHKNADHVASDFKQAWRYADIKNPVEFF